MTLEAMLIEETDSEAVKDLKRNAQYLDASGADAWTVGNAIERIKSQQAKEAGTK